MSEHLLLVSLGPIQDFIAQARRTRDLWFGSHVLSEVSKAAAKAIAGHDGTTLVFPALDRGAAELEECNEVRRAQGEMPYNVANKIVAVVHAGTDPGAVARAARAAARERLMLWGQDVLTRQTELVDPASQAAADEQLATLLEVRAVWAPIGKDGYAHARTHAEADLAARKTLHAFAPWQEQGGALKSSLDGARRTVLLSRPRTSKPWQQYRIGLREELDAVGLLKRAGGAADQFVPVPTLGLAAWIERAKEEQPRLLANLGEACKREDFQRVRTPLAWLHAFPYDAQVLLAERWQPYFADCLRPTTARERDSIAAQALAFGRKHVEPLTRKLGPPYPYIACLVADGDHMGEAIEALAARGPDAHRNLSARLADFAREAHRIVEREHHGVLVYAGGDDVLALVCVQHALACAAALRRCFTRIVGPFAADTVEPPTLSVGLGIGHVMQSLGHLLQLGRAAEQHAKHAGPALGQQDRNALAVTLERHAGTARTWRSQWTHDPLARLRQDVGLLAGDRLSASKVYQVQALLRRLPAPNAPNAPKTHDTPDAQDDQAHWAGVLVRETARILARTEAGALSLHDAGIDLDTGLGGDLDSKLDNRDYAHLHARIDEWTRRLIIAMDLARAHRAAPMKWTNDANDDQEETP